MAGVEIATGELVKHLIKWEAECPVCNSYYTWDASGGSIPSPAGHFCPECKGRGYTCLGVLHFKETM